MYDIAIVREPWSRMPLMTARATAGTLRLGARGAETLSVVVPATPEQALILLDQLGKLWLEIYAGASRVAVGRVETIAIGADGTATITAQGGWRVLSDAPYTALWSTTALSDWHVTTTPAVAPQSFTWQPWRFRTEVSSHLLMTLIKGTSYNPYDMCGMYFRVPNRSSRQIVGLQCVITDLLPTNWRYNIYHFADDNFAFPSYVLGAIATGVLRTRAYHLVIPAAGAVLVMIYNDTNAISTPAGETGSWYAIIERVRVVTSTTNRVNTTLTANRAAGTSVTATVGSTARMYVGMELVVNNGAAGSEIVVVESVVNATQFVATFANNHNTGEAVQGFVVQPDEIVRDIVATTPAVPAEVLRTSCTGLIQSCGRDLTNCMYEDASRADVIADLANSGDGVRRYAAAVNARGYLTFRDAALAEDMVSSPPEWLIDVQDLEIEQSLDSFVNAVYARYKADTGRTLRTVAQSRPGFAQPGDLIRTGYVDIDTQIRAGAEARALVAARDSDQIVASYTFEVKRLYTPSGSPAPLTAVEPGHVVGIRNLPPGRGGQRDAFVSFRIATVEIDLLKGTLKLQPEQPVPTPEYLQAAIQRAAEFASSAGQTPGGASGSTTAAEQARTTTLARPAQEQIRA